MNLFDEHEVEECNDEHDGLKDDDEQDKFIRV